MNSPIKIAVFTGHRADYGPLLSVIQAFHSNPNFNLQLLVGGGHLVEEYGYSIKQIEDQGLPIAAQFPFIVLDKNKETNVVQSMAKLQEQISHYFQNNKPDMLLVLGDRFELIPVVTTALLSSIPVAHLSGGEITEGAIDNQIRHAITKMSHLHFTSNELHAQNVKQMGEEPWRVFNVGEPALDIIDSIDYHSKEELFSELGLNLNHPTILATLHPETIDNQINAHFVKELYNSILAQTNYQILATAANFDEGGDPINAVLKELANVAAGFTYIPNLGQRRYFSALKHVEIVLGNSSSGLIEVQSFGKPVLNIGKRQQGRLGNNNVINVPADINAVLDGLKQATSDNFTSSIKGAENIFKKGNAAELIAEAILGVADKNLLEKKDIFKC